MSPRVILCYTLSLIDELNALERKVYDLKIDGALLQATVDRGLNGIPGPPGPKGETGKIISFLFKEKS